MGKFKRTMLFPAFVNLAGIIVCPLILWKFWPDLPPEEWTAIGTLSLAITTALLYFSAMWQLLLIKKEAKKNRTLDICNRYDNDPVFDQAMEKLADGKLTGDIGLNPLRYKKPIVTILNYLDSVAIGIEQGLYINDLAKDHLNEILQTHVLQYLPDTKTCQLYGYQIEHFARLMELSKKWDARPTIFRD